jgi:hypothetical protein
MHFVPLFLLDFLGIPFNHLSLDEKRWIELKEEAERVELDVPSYADHWHLLGIGGNDIRHAVQLELCLSGRITQMTMDDVKKSTAIFGEVHSLINRAIYFHLLHLPNLIAFARIHGAHLIDCLCKYHLHAQRFTFLKGTHLKADSLIRFLPVEIIHHIFKFL